MLFEDQTIDALQTLPNAGAHFAHYLTGPDCKNIRETLSEISQIAPETNVLAWKEALHSLNNAKSVQAFSEIVALLNFKKVGWTMQEKSHPIGYWLTNTNVETALLLSLSLIQQPTPEQSLNNRKRLKRVLNRIDSDRQIAIILRRPLPSQFDPSQIRLSISHWLDKDPSPGAFAYYKDQNIWLEVGVLETEPNDSDDIVAFIQGPLRGDTVWEHIQHQAETLIEHHNDEHDDVPILLSVNSIHPLPLLNNSLQFALYGPTQELDFAGSDSQQRRHKFDPTLQMGWFQKPAIETTVGLMVNQLQNNQIISHSYQNPWSRYPIGDFPIPTPIFELKDMEDGRPILGWNII